MITAHMRLTRFLRGAALTGTVALLATACSDGGSETILDAEPVVSVEVPQLLSGSSAISTDNIRPSIQLSNGAVVSMQRGAGVNWSGTVNVPTERTYEVRITWLEIYAGQDLPLLEKTQQIEIAGDGSVVLLDAGSYSDAIDSDADGRTNLQEREDGTNPFDSNDPLQTSPANDGDSGQSGDGSDGSGDGDGGDDTDSTVQTPAAPADTGSLSGDENTSTDPGPTADPDTSTDPDAAIEPDSSTDPDAANDSGTATDVPPPVTPATPAETEDNSDESTAGPDLPVLADLVIPRVAAEDVPVIDGKGVSTNAQGILTGEWAAAARLDNSGAPLFIDKLIEDIDAEAPDGTPYRQWAALHDGNYLYVVVLVDDNGDRHRDSGADLQNDDSLELFIDGDNSKGLSYDENDFHRILPVQLPGKDKRSASSGALRRPDSSAAELNLRFATGPGIGPDGLRRARFEQDVYEIRIGLASAGIDTTAPFGFELQVNDDDGGGERESRWAWKQGSGNHGKLDSRSIVPSQWGTLVLE